MGKKNSESNVLKCTKKPQDVLQTNDLCRKPAFNLGATLSTKRELQAPTTLCSCRPCETASSSFTAFTQPVQCESRFMSALQPISPGLNLGSSVCLPTKCKWDSISSRKPQLRPSVGFSSNFLDRNASWCTSKIVTITRHTLRVFRYQLQANELLSEKQFNHSYFWVVIPTWSLSKRWVIAIIMSSSSEGLRTEWRRQDKLYTHRNAATIPISWSILFRYSILYSLYAFKPSIEIDTERIYHLRFKNWSLKSRHDMRWINFSYSAFAKK